MAKILIVDDSNFLRQLLRRALEEKQYIVVEARDGYDGIEVLKQNHDIKLICCDINMPRLDGLSMCKMVKEMPEYQHIPILIVTTEASAEIKAEGKKIGVLGWVTKPFDAQKLQAAVEQLLGS